MILNSFDSMIERYKKELIDAKKRSISQEIEAATKTTLPEAEKESVPVFASSNEGEKKKDFEDSEKNEEALESEKSSEPRAEEESVTAPSSFDEETVEEEEPDESGEAKTLGSLRVQVFMANRAYPVPSAHVVITGTKNKRVYFDGYTDTNGVVGRLLLPAPKKVYSQSPQETPPYSQYDITVSHPKFQSRKYLGVPVFGGVESIQNIQLLPLGSDETDSMTVTESEPNELLKRGVTKNA